EIATLDDSKSRVFQCINTLKTIVPLAIKEGKAKAKFPKEGTIEAKKMENTFAIGISRAFDNELYFAKTQYNPYKTSLISVNWQNITSSDLKKELQSLDVESSPLIDLIEREEDIINKRKEIIAQKQQLNLQIEDTSSKLDIEQRKMAKET